MKTTATLAALAALTLAAHAVETTFGISTNAIGSSLDSDFHITETDKDTLVDGATFTVGSMSNTNNDLRAYLGFDLTGLTANGTVTNATLRLFRDVIPGSGFDNKDAYGNADVYARTAAFVAGAGGGTTDWDELTGTFLGTISANDLATAQYFDLDVTAIVESWRTNNLTNHFGFAMQGTETYTETGKQFQSRTGSNAPQLVVTQDPVPSNTFESWINNPSFGLAESDKDFSDDPDGDGLANGLEAWFGTHPGQFNAGLAGLATNGTVTTFTHPQNATPPGGVTGSYEWSPNLADWYPSGSGPAGGPTVTFVPHTVGTTTTVTATASEVLTRLFLDLIATQN
jgi:hypothetical protein